MTPLVTAALTTFSVFGVGTTSQVSEPLRAVFLGLVFFVVSSVIRRRRWTIAAQHSARRLAQAARVTLTPAPRTSGNLAS